MSIPAILLPVFAHVALILGLGVLLGRRRYLAARSGLVKTVAVSMGERNWPPAAQTASNAFSHQFELPLLFYALIPLAILTRKADLVFVVMSWIFVATRILHAVIYVTANDVPKRAATFGIGALVLFAMWIVFAVRILASPLPA